MRDIYQKTLSKQITHIKNKLKPIETSEFPLRERVQFSSLEVGIGVESILMKTKTETILQTASEAQE